MQNTKKLDNEQNEADLCFIVASDFFLYSASSVHMEHHHPGSDTSSRIDVRVTDIKSKKILIIEFKAVKAQRVRQKAGK